MPSSTSEPKSRIGVYIGLALAAVGLSHFAAPKMYEPVTTAVFPENTRTHVYANGAIETAIGLGLVTRRTRPFAITGLLGYIVYLAGNVARSR